MEPIKKPYSENLPVYLRRFGLSDVSASQAARTRLTHDARFHNDPSSDIEDAYDALIAEWAATRLGLQAANAGKAAAHVAALCAISGAATQWPQAFLANDTDVDDATWQAFKAAILEARRKVTSLPHETPTSLPAPDLELRDAHDVMEVMTSRIRRWIEDLRRPPASANAR